MITSLGFLCFRLVPLDGASNEHWPVQVQRVRQRMSAFLHLGQPTTWR